MPLDQFLSLLKNFVIGYRFVHKDIQRHRTDNTDILKSIETIKDLFDCSYNFYISKVVNANPVFNYLIGHKGALTILNILFQRFEKWAMF